MSPLQVPERAQRLVHTPSDKENGRLLVVGIDPSRVCSDREVRDALVDYLRHLLVARDDARPGSQGHGQVDLGILVASDPRT